MENVGFRAFNECTSLKDINWSNNIRKYDSDAFQGCTSLTHVELSSSLEEMGEYVFKNCINITSVTINEGCAVIGRSAFANCTKLQSVRIPNSVTNLSSSAFSGCSALTTAFIGDGVRNINSYAFDDCTSLETVRIGPNVTNIGFRAFNNCPALVSFTSYSVDVPSLNENGFSSYDAALYVPSSAVEAYKADKIWGKFGNKISALANSVYMTLKHGNSGSVKIPVNTGERYSYTIQPPAGGKIKSVTFNGTDVTAQLVDNTYLTPAITEDSEMAVLFDSDQASGETGDLNGDTKVDAADVVRLVNIIVDRNK